jgi:hypothetical protein
MKIDNTSMFFNATIKNGTATAAWGTAVGQSQKNGYKINTEVDGLSDLLIGMTYKINTDVVNLDISAGSKSRELLLFSVFDKVFINGDLLNNVSFILLLVKEHSSSHDGRIIISYPTYASYKSGSSIIKNIDAMKKMASKLKCPNGCWFVHDISIKNQDELHFHAIVVDDKSSVKYKSSQERKTHWDLLLEDYSTVKEQFKKYLLDIHKLKTPKTANEYINNLSKVRSWFLEHGLCNSDFQIWNVNNDVSKIQHSLSGTLKESWQNAAQKNAEGDNGFMMAAWNRWTEFLEWRKTNNSSFNQVEFNYMEFKSKSKDSGLIFSSQLIQRFVASLCTKPFVICTGLSGSGKTKLAQAFAQWICYKETDGEKNEQYCIVPVGADWTNREPLLGYPNALDKEEYVSPENGVLDLMVRAKNEYDIYQTDNSKIPKPYFLILDEMNLSHVERYFADFLSTMESGDKIPLHKIESESQIIPQSIKFPKNLFIIGTVNIDETTYMFSPKVLDRANTIEFRLTETDLVAFINSDVKLDMDLLKGQGANMSDSFMAMTLTNTNKNLKPSEEDLKVFFSELKKSGAEFGYRTASEIGRLMYMLKELGESGDNLLDIAIMQKLLPKLHGSRNKLTKVLPILGGFCLTDNSKIKEDYLDKFVSNSLTEVELKADTNIKYKISFEKICRMYKNAVENGFASYAEA